MAEIPNSIYKQSEANHGLHRELQDLIRRRAIPKHEVDLELEYITPLLEACLEEANDVATRVNNSLKRVESHIKSFKWFIRTMSKRLKSTQLGERRRWISLSAVVVSTATFIISTAEELQAGICVSSPLYNSMMSSRYQITLKYT